MLVVSNVCFVLSDRILKWSKKDGFYIMGFNQTFNISSFGKRRTTIISGLYKTSLPDDRVFSIKFAITGAILFDFCFTNS
jgi:ribosomal protein L30E